MSRYSRWQQSLYEKREARRRRKSHAKVVDIRVESNSDFSTGRAQLAADMASAPEVGEFLSDVLRWERGQVEIVSGVPDELRRSAEEITSRVGEIMEQARREWAAMSEEEKAKWR